MKYPVGIQTFDKIIEGGFVYVDKTDLIYSLVKEGTIYFLSRPRRFGKSLLISTLGSYFLGRKELFKGLAIEKLEKEWKEYPVFRVSFGSGRFTQYGNLENLLDGTLVKWERDYGVKRVYDDYGTRFRDILAMAREKTGLPCVVLVDEYDKPIIDVLGSGGFVEQNGEKVSIESHNRGILKSFYASLKDADEDLRFVFLTGVTKFAKVSVFSGFNQPLDISMDPRYDTLCGITEEEISQYFGESVKAMAVKFECGASEMRRRLRLKYDGYNFSEEMRGVHNPYSLLCSFAQKKLGDYWFSSGTPTYLLNLLDRDNVNMDEIVGKYYAAEEFMDFKMDRDAPLPMLYQSGYLTIKGYDARRSLYLLDIPNNEVKNGFIPLLASDYFKSRDVSSNWISQITDDLEAGDLESFRVKLTSFFANIPYNLRTKQTTERYFHCAFYLMMRMVSTYLIYSEKCQSQGRVDCVIKTDKFIYIFEFKLDGTAGEALQQINDKGYACEYSADSRNLFKIGCSFSSETGTIGEWKVDE